jgi:hypothetical protein
MGSLIYRLILEAYISYAQLSSHGLWQGLRVCEILLKASQVQALCGSKVLKKGRLRRS